MKKMLTVCCLVVSFAAFAQSAPPPAAKAPAPGAPAAAAPAASASAMDLSKFGGASRKPADEKKMKKEIEAFMKAAEMAEAKQDWDADLAMIDFPIYMATDDAKGTTEGMPVSKEQYIEMMKSMGEMPKDLKTTHKPTITMLSDALAVMVDDFTMTTGKTKLSGRNAALMVKVDGNWKRKVVVEGGWGGMMTPTKTTASAAPANGAPAAKAPASSAAAPPAKGGAMAPPPPTSAPAATGASAPPPSKK